MRLRFTIGLNTFYQIIGRAVTAISGLVATRLVTGALGVDGYGDYQIVLTYVTLFWMLTDFGLNAIAVRQMAEDEGRVEHIFNNLFTLRTFLGLLLMVVSWIIVLFLPYDIVLKQAIFLCSSTILLHAILGSAHGLFQLKLRYDLQLLGNIAGAITSLSLVFATVTFDWGIWGFWWAFVGATAAIALVNYVQIRRWVQVKVSRNKQQLKKLLKETIPFGTALLLSLATFKIDALLMSALPLQHVSNSTAVGVYNVAYRVFELVMVIPVFFMNPVYPVLVRKLSNSFEEFRKSVFAAAGVLFLGSIAVLVSLYVGAPYIIGLIAEGEGFTDSITVLRILALTTPLFFITALLMWNLVTLKKQRELILVYSVGFVVNLILNLIYLPQYYYFAAAVITGITESVILVVLIIFVARAWKERTNISDGKN